MRISLVLALATAVATASSRSALPSFQGAPPKVAQTPQPPAPPVEVCFELHLEHIAGAGYRWARLCADGEWITGCVGSPGECIAPIWVRC